MAGVAEAAAAAAAIFANGLQMIYRTMSPKYSNVLAWLSNEIQVVGLKIEHGCRTLLRCSCSIENGRAKPGK